MSDAAAGLDVCACLEQAVSAAPGTTAEEDGLLLAPGARVAVPTGLSMAVPTGYEIQVRPRSGLARTHGITVANAPGTIDADFRGEVLILLVNLGTEAVRIRHGDRIAQLVVAPVVRVHAEEVDALPETARGEGGFGSTGR
jgi:dUTP pyrophosphatase